MGTRGLFGFRKNNKDKAVYNHYDSYPDWLGKHFLRLIVHNKKDISPMFDRMIDIQNTTPTEEQKKYCMKMGWYDGSVSTRSDTDWYCLLHGLQDIRDWEDIIHNTIYFENSISFIKDSLFCEYAYIYDIDNNILEVYKGFQKQPDFENRYGTKDQHGYYPCKLVDKIKITDGIDIMQTVCRMNEMTS